MIVSIKKIFSMKKPFYLLVGLFSSFCLNLFGQEIERCAVVACQQSDSKRNPNLERNKRLFEDAVQNFMVSQSKNARVSEELIRIPVVVHVIHNRTDGLIGGSSNPNISDEQIYSQIKVLNEDYRRKAGTMGFNTNPVGADMEIEFFLATIDPQGNPSKGITRHFSSKKSFAIDTERALIANLARWDPNKYLNIYVADFNDPYIGWGEFPGAINFDGLESEDPAAEIDGVFIDHTVFGKQIGTNTKGIYKFGRTLTHEVGHWMGLIHTWGDDFCGDDFVADTPPTAKANNSNVCRVTFSTCNGTRTRDMIENYMDYSPDSCMNIFTLGQKQRARAALEVSKRRKRVVEYGKFQLPPSEKLQVTVYPHPATISELQIQVLLPDFQDFTVELYDLQGKKIYAETFKDFPSTIIKLKPEKISAGNYILAISSKNDIHKSRIFIN